VVFDSDPITTLPHERTEAMDEEDKQYLRSNAIVRGIKGQQLVAFITPTATRKRERHELTEEDEEYEQVFPIFLLPLPPFPLTLSSQPLYPHQFVNSIIFSFENIPFCFEFFVLFSLNYLFLLCAPVAKVDETKFREFRISKFIFELSRNHS
jgi:hypothetical protein